MLSEFDAYIRDGVSFVHKFTVRVVPDGVAARALTPCGKTKQKAFYILKLHLICSILVLSKINVRRYINIKLRHTF